MRRVMVLALTLFGLDDMMAHDASYETFAEIIPHRFDDPKEILEEPCSRLSGSVCGNISLQYTSNQKAKNA